MKKKNKLAATGTLGGKKAATGTLKVEGALSNHTAVTGFYLQAKLPSATCPRQKAASIRTSSHSTHTHTIHLPLSMHERAQCVGVP